MTLREAVEAGTANALQLYSFTLAFTYPAQGEGGGVVFRLCSSREHAYKQ